jgi:hypothetical protein
MLSSPQAALSSRAKDTKRALYNLGWKKNKDEPR